MNGAEIIIRATLIEPQTSQGMWEVQNRAHALFNNAIVVAPNLGPELGPDGVINDLFGGRSMIVNQRGRIITETPGVTAGDTFVSTTIDIDALRRDRQTNDVLNGFRDLRTEQYAAIYEKRIHRKNHSFDVPPGKGRTSPNSPRRRSLSSRRKLRQRRMLKSSDSRSSLNTRIPPKSSLRRRSPRIRTLISRA
jgi:hypothetical protein